MGECEVSNLSNTKTVVIQSRDTLVICSIFSWQPATTTLGAKLAKAKVSTTKKIPLVVVGLGNWNDM